METPRTSGAGAAQQPEAGGWAEGGYVIFLFPAVLVSVHEKVHPCLMTAMEKLWWQWSLLWVCGVFCLIFLPSFCKGLVNAGWRRKKKKLEKCFYCSLMSAVAVF